jgi:hypothetical protein
MDFARPSESRITSHSSTFSTSGVDGKLDFSVDADEPEIIASNRFRIGKLHKPSGPLTATIFLYESIV